MTTALIVSHFMRLNVKLNVILKSFGEYKLIKEINKTKLFGLDNDSEAF